jgi:hypothetical protein
MMMGDRLKVKVFSAQAYDKDFLTAANADDTKIEFEFFAEKLSTETLALALGCEGGVVISF